MITVEKVKEKLNSDGAETRQNNEELLKTGVVKKKSNNIWLWVLGIGAIAVGVYLYFKDRKGIANSGANTGISSQD